MPAHTAADLDGHCPADDGQLSRADLALWRASGARSCQLRDVASGRADVPVAMLRWLSLAAAAHDEWCTSCRMPACGA